ncbi:MAG: Mur ligase family protein [Candidatus Falkowbacteria bacterium]
MRKILQFKLKILAQMIMRKYKPHIIGITGSIGKTSAKEAICKVLENRFRVRASFKNYNNELGLPLTIIGYESAGKSLSGWFLVFLKAWKSILVRDKNYPEILVLEMGVDRPGDMAYLCSIVKPEVGIVTAVSYSHLEYFGSVANIKKEKQVLIERVDNHGLSVLNYDNDLAREMSEVSHAKVMTYGLKEGADLRAQDISYNFAKGDYDLSGLHFKMGYGGAIVPVFMKNVLSEPSIYAALAGAAVGLHFNLNLVEIAGALNDFNLPAGRMNLLPGLNHTFIIDDTYNSSPEACLAALNLLAGIRISKEGKKYAVLGDMMEIGDYTEEGHTLVGAKVASCQIDYLVAVGTRAEFISRGAKEAGLKEDHIFHFNEAKAAGEFLENRLNNGDVILVKGSQSMRMEKVVLSIMAEPERAPELLVRQGASWK